MLQLCRLCLVKDNVNIPIFEEQGDISQIFQKISSCLPVKVSREDKLPQKICDGCSYKLDVVYDFRNTTVNAEKQLLTWLSESQGTAAAALAGQPEPEVTQQIKPAETFVKQEAIDPSDISKEEDDVKSYMFHDKYEEPENKAAENEDEPPPKRAKRTAAVKAALAIDDHESDEDDDDSGEPLTKVEDESDDGSEEDHTFVDIPSTSADDQPGPSGVGKDGGEAPKMGVNHMKELALRQGQTCRVIMNDVLENIIMDKKTGAGWIEVLKTETKANSRQLLAETRKSLSTNALKRNSMIRCYLPNSIHSLIWIKNKSEIINSRIQNIGSLATIHTVDITEEIEEDEVENSSLLIDPLLGIRVIQIGERDQRNIANATRSTKHISTNLNEVDICKGDPYIVDTFEISDNEFDQINKLGANINQVVNKDPSVSHYTIPIVDLVDDDTQTKKKCITESKRGPHHGLTTMKDTQRQMFIDFIRNPNSSRLQPESFQNSISNETINVPDDSDITENMRQVENLTRQNITFSLADSYHSISPISGIVNKNYSPNHNVTISRKFNNKEIEPPLAAEIQELGLIQCSDNNLELEDAIYIADSPESPSFICAVCDLSFSEEEQLDSHKKIHPPKRNSEGQTFIISKIGIIDGQINAISSSSEVIPALTAIPSEINKSNIIPGGNSSGQIPITKVLSPFQINNTNIKPGVYFINGNEVRTNYTIPNSDEIFIRGNTRPISPKVHNISKTDRIVGQDKRVPKKNFTSSQKILPKDNNGINSKTGGSNRINHFVPRINMHANLNYISRNEEVPSKEIRVPSVRCKSLNLLTDRGSNIKHLYENRVDALDNSQTLPRNSALLVDSHSTNNKLLAKKKLTPPDQVRRQRYSKKSSKNLEDRNEKDPSHSPVKLITVAPITKKIRNSSSKQENTTKVFRNDDCDNNNESWIPKITTVMSLNDEKQNSEIIKSINEVAKVVKNYDVSQRDDAGDIESELPLSMILKK